MAKVSPARPPCKHSDLGMRLGVIGSTWESLYIRLFCPDARDTTSWEYTETDGHVTLVFKTRAQQAHNTKPCEVYWDDKTGM